MTTEHTFRFDFALSFAGENRETAEQLRESLRKRGAEVYYDRHFKSWLLGKRLGGVNQSVYGAWTRYVVVLVSMHYYEKDWCLHEFAIAMQEAKGRPTEFILPVRLDDTILPGLPSDTVYLDLREDSIDAISDYLMEKLRSTELREEPPPTRWIATFGINIAEEIDEIEIPPTIPRDYVSVCDWLEEDLNRRLVNSPIGFFSYPELSLRNGECLSVRIWFHWDSRSFSLDFGDLGPWVVLEVAPISDVYPEEEED